jgi:hypothetical protein
MKLHIEIDMSGAAFESQFEAGRILDTITRQAQTKNLDVLLLDINGNTCGRAWTTED